MVFRNNKAEKYNKKVIYPIFVECADLSTDEYWKTLYTNLAINKCPKNIYISNFTINSSNKQKKYKFAYCFKYKKASEVIVELYDLLTKYTSLSSVSDNKKRQDEIDNIKEKVNEMYNCEWKSIKKKNIKNLLISDFVINMKNKYKLSWEATFNLSSLIKNYSDTIFWLLEFLAIF
jgi:hypothetical protein